MQMTLDGFVEGPNGEMDWLLGGEEIWQEMFKDIQSVDTYMLGSGAYPGYSTYWRSVLTNPSSDKNELTYAMIADGSPHIVFSKSIKTVDWRNTRIATDPQKEIEALKKQPGKDIVIWGGASLAASCISQGLVDRYRITLNPIILGGGKSLFSAVAHRQKLKLLEVRPMSSGMTILWYDAVK